MAPLLILGPYDAEAQDIKSTYFKEDFTPKISLMEDGNNSKTTFTLNNESVFESNRFNYSGLKTKKFIEPEFEKKLKKEILAIKNDYK